MVSINGDALDESASGVEQADRDAMRSQGVDMFGSSPEYNNPTSNPTVWDPVDSDKLPVVSDFATSKVGYWPDMEKEGNCLTLEPGLQLCRIDPDLIQTDAEAFQFKSAGDGQGVTGVLSRVKTWSNDASGIAFVWIDPNGVPYIADGHQRLDTAKRLKREARERGDLDTANNIYIVAKVWDSKNFHDEKGNRIPVTDLDEQKSEMRFRAAKKNIAEQTGSAVDAATMIRERGIESVSDLAPTALLSDAKALAAMSEQAYSEAKSAIQDKKLDSKDIRFILDAKPLPSAELQVTMVHALIDARVKKGHLLQEEANALIAYVRQSHFKRVEADGVRQTSFVFKFDTEAHAWEEFAALKSALTKTLHDDKLLFSRVNRGTSRLQGVEGTSLNVDKNQAIQEEVSEALTWVDVEASAFGPLFDYLSAKAQEIATLRSASGQSVNAIINGSGARKGAKPGERTGMLAEVVKEVVPYLERWNTGGRAEFGEKYGTSSKQIVRVDEDALAKSRRTRDSSIKKFDERGLSTEERLEAATDIVAKQNDKYAEAYAKSLSTPNADARSRLAELAEGFRVTSTAWHEYVSRIWLEARPNRLAELTPDKVPPELEAYKSDIPYAIGQNDDAKAIVDNIEQMAAIRVKDDDYRHWSAEQLNTYIALSNTVSEGFDQLIPQDALSAIRQEMFREHEKRVAEERQIEQKARIREFHVAMDEWEKATDDVAKATLREKVRALVSDTELLDVRYTDEYKEAVARRSALVLRDVNISRPASADTTPAVKETTSVAARPRAEYEDDERYKHIADGGSNASNRHGYATTHLATAFAAPDMAWDVLRWARAVRAGDVEDAKAIEEDVKKRREPYELSALSSPDYHTALTAVYRAIYLGENGRGGGIKTAESFARNTAAGRRERGLTGSGAFTSIYPQLVTGIGELKERGGLVAGWMAEAGVRVPEVGSKGDQAHRVLTEDGFRTEGSAKIVAKEVKPAPLGDTTSANALDQWRVAVRKNVQEPNVAPDEPGIAASPAPDITPSVRQEMRKAPPPARKTPGGQMGFTMPKAEAPDMGGDDDKKGKVPSFMKSIPKPVSGNRNRRPRPRR